MPIHADHSRLPTFYTSVCKALTKAIPFRPYAATIAFLFISTSASAACTAGSLTAEAKSNEACDGGTTNASNITMRSTGAMQLLQAKTFNGRLQLRRGDELELGETDVEDAQRALDNGASIEEYGDPGASLERHTHVEIELVQTILLKSNSSLHRIATHVKRASVGSFLFAIMLIAVLLCAAFLIPILADPNLLSGNQQRDHSLTNKYPSPLQPSKKAPETRDVPMPPSTAWQNTWQAPPVSQSNPFVAPPPPNLEVATPSSSSFGPRHLGTNTIVAKQERQRDVQRDVSRRESSQRDESYLCVKLVVPSKSECLLIIPTQPARRSMFDITDQSGNVVLRVVLRGPSVPLSASGTSRGPAGSLEASGAKRLVLTSIEGEVLAQVCQVRTSPIPGAQGVSEFHLLRGTGDFFGTLAQSADGNSFELTTPAGKDLRFQADKERGGFEQHNVRVHMKDSRAKLLATTERCQVSFDDGSRGYYRLRLAQYADVGAVVCGLLAVYHLAD